MRTDQTQTRPKRGRPPIDRSHLLGKMYPDTFLSIEALTGRNRLNKPMALTRCHAPDKKTGLACGKLTPKRLDQIIEGRIVSCDCVRAEQYMRWKTDVASKVQNSKRSEIWDAHQTMPKKEFLIAFRGYQPATLAILVRWERERLDKILIDFGEAIWKEMKTMRDCVETGKLFKLSGTATRWILAEVEKLHLHPAVLSKEQQLDADYRYGLKLLRLRIQDTGWGKRQYPVFSSKELTFCLDGGLNGSIMPILWWAEWQTATDPELIDLCSWLNETIEATRIHRKKLRKQHAVMAEKLAA